MKAYMEREKEEINVGRDDYPKVETKTIEGRDGLSAELRRPGGLPFWEVVEVRMQREVDTAFKSSFIGTEDLDALIDLLTAVQAEVRSA